MAFDVDIKLNKNHLDQNAIEQVDLYEKCTDKWADAVLTRDEAKENLTVIKAEVDEEIRANPLEHGWSSESKTPTETWISNQVTLNERVREATTKHLKTMHKVNQLSGDKETLEHRKKALDILTELYKGQYFVAVGRTDDNYKKAITDEGKEAQRDVLNKSERLRRRRP